MKKIVVINNGTLPLPAVKGGAVETLINLLIDENEIFGKFQFEVYSIYDSEAVVHSKKYKYTSFCFVKTSGVVYSIKYALNKIANAVYNRTIGYYHSYPLHRQIVKNVKKTPNDYAAILLEGSSLDACYLKEKTRLPIIQRIHNTPTRPLGKFDVLCAKSTDLYLGISKYICDVLRAEEGKYSNNIELLYNSIPFKYFKTKITHENKMAIRKDLGFAPNDFIVMFSGRLREYKGVKELLLAIEKCKDNPQIKLLIVGSHIFSSNVSSPFIASLKPIIERLGDRVKFTGYVKYEAMYKYYQVADICSFPSTWEEPFALTCLEGITSGKPVVITNSGGMPEMVDDKCSIIVPNDASLSDNLAKSYIMLSKDKGRIEAMSKAASDRAELFSPENQYKCFVNLMNKYVKI